MSHDRAEITTFDDVEQRWRLTETEEDQVALWDELANYGWLTCCQDCWQRGDEATLGAWLDDSDTTKRTLIALDGEASARVVRAYLLSAKAVVACAGVGAHGELHAVFVTNIARLTGLAQAFVQNAVDSVQGRPPRSADKQVRVPFPMVWSYGHAGTLAHFILERQPDGEGDVFWAAEQALRPQDDFRTALDHAVQALRTMRPRAFLGVNVRVSVEVIADSTQWTREWRLQGTSAGCALALGLWSLETGQPLDRGCIASAAITPSGLLQPVGAEITKALGVARAGFGTFVVAEGQQGQLPAIQEHTQLRVRRATNLAQAVAAASERIRALEEYFGALEREHSLIFILGRELSLNKVYLGTRGKALQEDRTRSTSARGHSANRPVRRTGGARPNPRDSQEPRGDRWTDEVADDDTAERESFAQGGSADWEVLRPKGGGPEGEAPFGRQWIILGDAGSGKTTWLRHEALTLIAEARRHLLSGSDIDEVVIPVTFEAKDFSPEHPRQPQAYIGERVSACAPQERRQTLRSLIEDAWQDGRCVVLFDGFDETTTLRGKVQRAANACVATGNSVFVTTRTAAWQEDSIVGEARFHLEPLDPDSIDSFIRNWFGDELEALAGLRHELEVKTRLADLATNPLMLSLICRAYRPGRALPATQAGLLWECLTVLLGKWAEDRPPTPFSSATKLLALQALGSQWAKTDREWMPESEVELLIQALLNERSDGSASDLLTELVEREGVLRCKRVGPLTSYDFPFTLLGEYLAAQHIMQQELWRERVRVCLRDVSWYSVLPLVAGECGRTNLDPSPLLADLLALADDRRGDRLEFVEGLTELALARLSVESLLECPSSLSKDLISGVWEVALRGIETHQRRQRAQDWAMLADQQLVHKVLQAAELHCGGSSAELADRLLIHAEEQATSAHIEQLLASTCPVVRWLAVWLVGKAEVTDLAEEVAARLADAAENCHVRSLSARVLVRQRFKRFCTGLLQHVFAAAEDPLDEVSAGAAIALGRLGSEDAFRVLLQKAKRETHLTVRIAALGALDWYLGEKRRRDALDLTQRTGLVHVLEAALEEQGHSEASLRSSAASALGKLQTVSCVARLKARLEDPTESTKVYGAACYALDQIAPVMDETGRAELRAFLRGQLARASETAVGIRRAAASALGKLLDFEAVDDLIRVGGEDEDEVVARNCLFALTRFADASVTEKIAGWLESASRDRTILLLNIVEQNQLRAGGEKLLCRLLGARSDHVVEATCHAISRIALRRKDLPNAWAAEVTEASLRVATDEARKGRTRVSALLPVRAFAETRLPGVVDNTELGRRIVATCQELLETRERITFNAAAFTLTKLADASPQSFDGNVAKELALLCLAEVESGLSNARPCALAVLAALTRHVLNRVDIAEELRSQIKAAALTALHGQTVEEQINALFVFQGFLRSLPACLTQDDIGRLWRFTKENGGHEDARMRATVAATLGDTGVVCHNAPLVLEPLSARLGDPDAKVRQVSGTAVTRVMGAVMDKVDSYLQDKTAQSRSVITHTFARQCIVLAGSSAPAVAASAMIALQDLLKRRLLSDELAEQAADAVLRQLAVPRHRAKGVRRETAIRWHYGVQTSALGAVQRLAKTEYLQAPENREIALGHARLLADSSDEHVRASACGVLGVLGDGDDVALLRELAAREASPVVRRSIAWAQSMLWG